MTHPIARFNKRKSNCTLSAENVGSLATNWDALFNMELLGGFMHLIRNPENEGYKNMQEHDPELHKMLKTWQQSTRLVSEAIEARVNEIKELQAEIEDLATRSGMTPTEYVQSYLANKGYTDLKPVGPKIEATVSNDPTPPEAA